MVVEIYYVIGRKSWGFISHYDKEDGCFRYTMLQYAMKFDSILEIQLFFENIEIEQELLDCFEIFTKIRKV